MSDIDRYKDMYDLNDQINFQRRQCEATEKVGDRIFNLTLVILVAAAGIITAILMS